MENDTESNTELSPRRILHIEVSSLVWELLVEDGRGLERKFDISPHQVAKRLLLEKMKEKKMLPKKDPTILALELIYNLGKFIKENGEQSK